MDTSVAAKKNMEKPAAKSQPVQLSTPSDRRADVDAKHEWLSELLSELECDGLLLRQEENFAWLTSGAAPRGIIDENALPCLYFTPEGRWLVCSNVDTQRIFDEEIDGLGFQLKEWPWHWGRDSLLSEICQGRNVACDQPLANFKDAREHLAIPRRCLSQYERACLRALGQIVAHALEATGRTLSPGESEREIAGQIGHRLYHRGAFPVRISVCADGRSRVYRQAGFTSTPVQTACVMSVTARKYGLHVTASRSIHFGEPDPLFRKEHDAVCRVSATYIASSWPDAMVQQIIATGRRVYQMSDAEHEWALAPQGYVTGRLPVELSLPPDSKELLQSDWAVCWNSQVGAATSSDTFLIAEEGARSITPTESWPLKQIRVQGAEFVRPDILIRER